MLRSSSWKRGKLILPVDQKKQTYLSDWLKWKILKVKQVDPGFLGLDIGPKSIAKLDEALTGAKQLWWNGPSVWKPRLQAGTIGMDAIAKQPGVKSIIGGASKPSVAINLGRADKFSWISYGRGASMELFEGKFFQGLQLWLENNLRMKRVGKPQLFSLST